MADCELTTTCIFFNDHMTEMPTMSAIMKDRYCKGSNSQCARYVVFRRLGREAVPSDLYPSQIDRAEELIREKG